MNKYLIMTPKELDIKTTIDKLLNKEILVKDAAFLIGKSLRQTIRIRNNYVLKGVEGIIHKARGGPSNHKSNELIYKEAIDIIKEKYSDFGPTLAKEKLEDNHNIIIKISTLRKEMIKSGIWKYKKRKKETKQFNFRIRKENIGDMIQYDGSYHKWFEGRDNSDYQCLLVAVDDASGNIVIKFDRNEGIKATFNFWKEYIIKYGKPYSIYLDKFSTYKINYPEAEHNKELVTQFGRVCSNLGIKLIFANTPQAKGRVERMNKTLQDRLIKELRLENISNIEKANEFLKEKFEVKFNKKFQVLSRGNSNLHKPLRQDELDRLDSIFSIHHKRKIGNDYTVMFKNKLYQLFFSGGLFLKGNHVLIEEYFNGDINIKYKDRSIEFREIIQRPKRANIQVLAPSLPKMTSYFEKTGKCHPWMKNFKLNTT